MCGFLLSSSISAASLWWLDNRMTSFLGLSTYDIIVTPSVEKPNTQLQTTHPCHLNGPPCRSAYATCVTYLTNFLSGCLWCPRPSYALFDGKWLRPTRWAILSTAAAVRFIRGTRSAAVTQRRGGIWGSLPFLHAACTAGGSWVGTASWTGRTDSYSTCTLFTSRAVTWVAGQRRQPPIDRL